MRSNMIFPKSEVKHEYYVNECAFVSLLYILQVLQVVKDLTEILVRQLLLFFQKCILILYNGKTKSMTQKHIKQMNSTCNAVFRLKVTVKCRCLYRYSVYENQLIPRKT